MPAIPRTSLPPSFLLLSVLLLPGAAATAEPMDLGDPRSRRVDVQFRIHADPLDRAPVRTDWIEARLDPIAPGRALVRIPGEAVERSLFFDQRPEPGSFSDFQWLFDTETGHVESARLSGVLRHRIGFGPFGSDVDARVRIRLSTRQDAGYRPPRRRFGSTIHAYCEGAESDGDGRDCTVVPGAVYDPDTGRVRAVGDLSAHSGLLETRTFAPFGDARFREHRSLRRAEEVPRTASAGDGLPAVAVPQAPEPAQDGGGGEVPGAFSLR